MKTIKPSSMVAALFAVCAATAVQSTPRDRIQAFYAKFDALTVKKDLPGLEKLMDDNYTKDHLDISGPDPKGKVTKTTRADWSKQIKQVWQFVDVYKKVVTHVDHLKVGKDSIIALTSLDAAARTNAGNDGKAHEILFHTTTQDTWIKVSGAWRFKTSKTLTEKASLDGHPLPLQ